MKVVIKKINDTVSFPSGFQKREMIGVDNENPQYPQYLKFEFLKDAVSKLDSFSEGQEVEVSYNLRGSEYDNPTKGLQYFVSLQAWKIESVSGSTNETVNNDDDLPF